MADRYIAVDIQACRGVISVVSNNYKYKKAADAVERKREVQKYLIDHAGAQYAIYKDGGIEIGNVVHRVYVLKIDVMGSTGDILFIPVNTSGALDKTSAVKWHHAANGKRPDPEGYVAYVW